MGMRGDGRLWMLHGGLAVPHFPDEKVTPLPEREDGVCPRVGKHFFPRDLVAVSTCLSGHVTNGLSKNG